MMPAKVTKLRSQQHTISEEMLVEIWYGEKFIGAIYAADGPGVRVVSKYAIEAEPSALPGVVEVKIKL